MSESSTSAKAIQYSDLAYELLGGWLPDHIKGPDVVKTASDYAKGEYWGGFGLVMHYAAGVYGLYQAANPHADPYDRAEGGAAFVGHAAGAVAGLLESLRGAETVLAIGVEGAAGAASIVLSIVGAEAELFKWTLAKPLQDAAEASKESGRDSGSRLGFSAGILTSDHAWVKDHFLGVFLQPIPGEDEFGQLRREAFVHEFIESYREAQNMPASAAQAYRTCVVDVLAREHYVGPATPDQFEGLVWTLAHASDMARHACEGVATAIAADRDEFSGIFDMTADATAAMTNLEADAAAVKFNLVQDAEASPGIPSDQAQGPASVAAHDEPATVGAPLGPAAPAGPTEVDNDGDGVPDGTAAAPAAPAAPAGPAEVDNDGDGAADGTAAAPAAPAAPAGPAEVDNDGDGAADGTAAAPAALIGGDADQGAAAGPYDPGHTAVTFGPPAPAGGDADQGAAAGPYDPGHTAVTFGPPAPAGGDADQGAAAGPYDPGHTAVTFGPPAPAGHHADQGAAAGPYDPGHTAVTFGPPAPAGHHADQGAAAGPYDPGHTAVTFGPPAPAGHHADQGAAAGPYDPGHTAVTFGPPAPAGHHADQGAAACPYDPGHTAVTFGPPAPAGHHADQGAAAGPYDPGHTAVTFGPPAPAGHHADQGAAAGPYDPSHGQSQNTAQQLSLQMYQQAQHVDQQTQHVHEPAHQQAYDPGGHGE